MSSDDLAAAIIVLIMILGAIGFALVVTTGWPFAPLDQSKSWCPPCKKWIKGSKCEESDHEKNLQKHIQKICGPAPTPEQKAEAEAARKKREEDQNEIVALLSEMNKQLADENKVQPDNKSTDGGLGRKFK